MQLLRLLATCFFISLLAACASSPYSQKSRQESLALTTQQVRSANDLIQSKHVSLIYTGYALSNASTAFLGDIRVGADLMTRMNAENVKLLFSNVPTEPHTKLPFATEFDLWAGIAATARLAAQAQLREGRPPLIVMLLTTHGNKDILSIKAGDTNKTIASQKLAEALKPLEKFPTWLIISACHSGSLIPALQHDNRIIMTASSAERVSFGCQPSSQNTLYVESLRSSFEPGLTIQMLHKEADILIASKERKLRYPASQPQLWIGKNMLEMARSPLGEPGSTSLALPEATQATLGVQP